ncbi:MAG: PQQ-dependent sugar dehydrogenase [Chitinophagales bacterium]
MFKRLRNLLVLLTLAFSTNMYAQPVLDLVDLPGPSFNSPVDIASAGDSRLFIVEQDGYIYILNTDGTSSLFMDIDSKVKSTGDEQGLLGLAFDPEYATNGYFYVNYTNNTGTGNTVVARYSRNAINPNIGDVASEVILLTVVQPYTNHNGGNIEFGPDGYLYIGNGDGGSGGDPGDRAQDITAQLLGKMLRIDVSTVPYSIPADNPFVGVTGDDEIWQYGLRNPWRFSFDRLTGDLWIGDVGQGAWEEVDFQPAASTGGENWGWRCYEGNATYNTAGCTGIGNYDFPIFVYPHVFATGGYAIIGGIVYRGDDYPGMYGYYIFTDNVTDNWWTTYPNGVGGWTTVINSLSMDDITTYGEGYDGEIYCAARGSGNIYHVIDACGNFSLSTDITDANFGTNNGAIDLVLTGGTAPFSYDWSNGSTTQDISSLGTGNYSVTVVDDIGCVREADAFVDEVCGAIPTITTTATTSTTASFDWVDEEVIKYKVQYRPTAGGAWTNTMTTVSNITLTGLTPATSYKMKVMHTCPGGIKYSKSKNFMTTARLSSGEETIAPEIIPNPGSGLFNILNLDKNTTVMIFDLTGKQIGEFNALENSTLDLTSYAEGVYIVQFIKDNTIITTQKLIIAK